jgi:hypothetical protein
MYHKSVEKYRVFVFSVLVCAAMFLTKMNLGSCRSTIELRPLGRCDLAKASANAMAFGIVAQHA